MKLALMFLLGAGAASVPPRVIVAPHICAPISDSPAFQKCKADCPDGDAAIWESRTDVFCLCKKPPEGT